MNKIIGLAFIALGIFLEVMWLGFVFGSVVIGILLLIFAPRVLFFPFTFFLLIGGKFLYAEAFRAFEDARKNGGSYTYTNYSHTGYSNGSGGAFNQTTSINKMEAYYSELECSPNDDFSVVKKNYRRLMKEHHYDSLVSKGLPKDMLEFSEEKTKRLNEAYAAIKELKG
jgi:hypothetical protein